jgi:hypothetical protein
MREFLTRISLDRCGLPSERARCDDGAVLIPLSHLIRDGRLGRARVTELGRLLARFEAQPGPMLADPSVRAMAERIVHLKRQVRDAFGEVRACSSCARGCVAPSGFFEGGRCCGTATLDVFTQPEARAMKLAGVAPPQVPAEDGDERAGCLFRSSTSCTLPIEQRPVRCVVYVCHELRMEIEETERYERIQKLRRELSETFARFEEMTR